MRCEITFTRARRSRTGPPAQRPRRCWPRDFGRTPRRTETARHACVADQLGVLGAERGRDLAPPRALAAQPGHQLLRALELVRAVERLRLELLLLLEQLPRLLLLLHHFKGPARALSKPRDSSLLTHAADVAGRALPALRAAVAQLCRHGPGPMHHSNAQEAWLALVQGARRPPPARSFRPSNDQGDLLESTLPAEVEAAMKPPRVMYRAAATGLDRAHDAGLGGSC